MVLLAWQLIPSSRWEDWRRVFNRTETGADVDGLCPICGQGRLHRWLALDAPRPGMLSNGEPHLGYGRLWEWCSNCLSYEYIPDGFVPAWWQPPFDVEPTSIGVTPQVVEEARRRATDHEAEL